jgi:glycerol uptake facilitator-like aquaporin
MAGTLLGTLVTFLIVGTGGYKYVALMCPKHSQKCALEGQHLEAFSGEFAASLVFIANVMVVCNYKPLGNKMMKFAAPLLVTIGLLTAELINEECSNGPFNPTIAIQALIWGSFTYGDQFAANNYARYAWAYVFGPLFAALVAGIGTRFYLKQQEEVDMKGTGQNELFINEGDQ